MSIKNEIESIRKEKLGLNRHDTELILNTLMSVYKNKIVNENQEVMGYTLDIVFTNINGFNRLGDVKSIYQRWGDNFYIDFINSAFCKEVVNQDGDLFSDESEIFTTFTDLNKIKDISFSLKDLIVLCNENNINIKLFTKDDYSTMTTLEMKLYENFDPNENSINKYLSTVVVDK